MQYAATMYSLSVYLYIEKELSIAGLPDGLLSNQKSKIWVKFGGSCAGRCWFILWTLDQFYSLLFNFMDFWYSS
jgi:hypothetical protein